jgi:hypothetical protein
MIAIESTQREKLLSLCPKHTDGLRLRNQLIEASDKFISSVSALLNLRNYQDYQTLLDIIDGFEIEQREIAVRDRQRQIEEAIITYFKLYSSWTWYGVEEDVVKASRKCLRLTYNRILLANKLHNPGNYFESVYSIFSKIQ